MPIGDSNEFLFDPKERFILNANSPVPLYHQLEQVLQERILCEEAVGKMIPPEKDLMLIFGVSRATVKKTLDNLSQKGLIERRRAIGTRVINHEITEELARLSSYTEEMRRSGLTVRSEIMNVTTHEPDEAIRNKLRLAPGAQTILIERLRGTTDIFPVVYLRSEIPTSFGIDPNEDFSGSLYDIIERKYRIPIEWADEVIRASKATTEEARFLELDEGDAVLVIERTTASRNDQPLEFVRGVYRPEHYKFQIRLKRV